MEEMLRKRGKIIIGVVGVVTIPFTIPILTYIVLRDVVQEVKKKTKKVKRDIEIWSLEQTLKLQLELELKKFIYEQSKVQKDIGLKPSDAGFCEWLKDVKKVKIDCVLTNCKQELQAEYEKYLTTGTQELPSLNIEAIDQLKSFNHYDEKVKNRSDYIIYRKVVLKKLKDSSNAMTVDFLQEVANHHKLFKKGDKIVKSKRPTSDKLEKTLRDWQKDTEFLLKLQEISQDFTYKSHPTAITTSKLINTKEINRQLNSLDLLGINVSKLDFEENKKITSCEAEITENNTANIISSLVYKLESEEISPIEDKTLTQISPMN
ncbi:unnamed protein product [Rhizophagus irregularis]|nr:unnamed protein product [Rhizophagus irregularis]